MEIGLAILLSAVQLYADFGGCMDIVRGISQVIGIELSLNFKQPFFATNVQAFWARWHITLGAFTKEYLYLPIVMHPKFSRWMKKLKKDNKVWLSSFLKAFCPLMAVWLFTGLWHGTGADYLVWGLYWCLLMTLSKEAKPITDKFLIALHINPKTKAYQCWSALRTGLLFAVGRTITITGSLAGCTVVWKQLFAEHRFWVLFDGSLYTHGLEWLHFIVAIVFMVAMLVVDVIHEKGIKIRALIAKQKLPLRWVVYYGAIIALIVFGMYGPGLTATSFVYGAF